MFHVYLILTSNVDAPQYHYTSDSLPDTEAIYALRLGRYAVIFDEASTIIDHGSKAMVFDQAQLPWDSQRRTAYRRLTARTAYPGRLRDHEETWEEAQQARAH